ncbi:MAG: ferredoxin family protein [Desulfobacterales bacterium]|nr:ferredoxin family protein [Desulfobacterales bacterium]
MPPVIDASRCIGCGTCVEICPGDILAETEKEPAVVYPDECFHCGACLVECPSTAISYRIPLPMMLPVFRLDFFKSEDI